MVIIHPSPYLLHRELTLCYPQQTALPKELCNSSAGMGSPTKQSNASIQHCLGHQKYHRDSRSIGGMRGENMRRSKCLDLSAFSPGNRRNTLSTQLMELKAPAERASLQKNILQYPWNLEALKLTGKCSPNDDRLWDELCAGIPSETSL